MPNDQSHEDFEPVPKRPKKPVAKEHCKEFACVLHSARTIAHYNHLQASETKFDAAVVSQRFANQ